MVSRAPFDPGWIGRAQALVPRPANSVLLLQDRDQLLELSLRGRAADVIDAGGQLLAVPAAAVVRHVELRGASEDSSGHQIRLDRDRHIVVSVGQPREKRPEITFREGDLDLRDAVAVLVASDARLA